MKKKTRLTKRNSLTKHKTRSNTKQVIRKSMKKNIIKQRNKTYTQNYKELIPINNTHITGNIIPGLRNYLQ
jgi:hypothetical protein